ncbi:MAG: DUF5050 domain-containing protein [Clostridia bacterium]
MEPLQRLQFDLEEQISRKEYLKRKRKNSKLLKKRSKITYILMATFMALAVYIVVQVIIYNKYNNFKYTLGEGVNDQAVYNIYFVTEGYTYDPVYSISSISSLGENEKAILPSSNIDYVTVEKDFLYGIRKGILCKINKSNYEVEDIINDEVNKYVKYNNMIFYTSTQENILKSYNLDNNSTNTFDIKNVEQILANSDNVFAITHTTDEKAIYRFNYDGQGKNKISGDAKVSYAIEDFGKIYFVNKSDSNKIYRVDASGSNLTSIGDIKSISNSNIKEVNGNKCMFVKNNKLYYINPDDEDSLWSYDLLSGEKERIISASIEILQNVDNTVFYKIDNEMGVYLYNYDTKFMSLVTKRRVKEFVIDTYTDIIQEVK